MEKPRLFTVTLSENPTEREKEWCEMLAKAYHERIVKSGEYDVIKKKMEEEGRDSVHEMLYGAIESAMEQRALSRSLQQHHLHTLIGNKPPYTHEELMEGHEL